MYLSEMDLLKARLTAEGRLSQSRILQEILREDSQSEQKRKMREGERYYRCDHDILRKDFRRTTISETKNGAEELKPFFNPNRSNHHNVNPFHHTLVAQKAAYLVGREPTIMVKGEEKSEYEGELAAFCDAGFNRLLHRWVVGAANKGVEYLHVYYNEDGEFCTCIVPAEELIVCYDAVHQEEMTDVIRYYDIKVLEDGKEHLRRQVEWWTKDDVTYFSENSQGEFLQKKQVPHWLVTKEENGEEVERIAHN